MSVEPYEPHGAIRALRDRGERQYKARRIGGYCHLSSGQEATPSVASTPEPTTSWSPATDATASRSRVAYPRSPSWRSSSDAAPAAPTVAAVRCTCWTSTRGFYGGWGIVAGQLPMATGLALGLVRQGRQQAVLCELGDGAVNMGAWHEALNLAALWQLPVVFLVINNGYGMGTSVDARLRRARALAPRRRFRMHGERVDGNDLEASSDACERLLARAREERRAGAARGRDLPLPRPLGRRRRHRLPDQGRGGRASGPRPDLAHPRDC